MKKISSEIPASAITECGRLDGARFLSRFVAVTFFTIFVASFFLPWTQTIHGSGKVIAFSPADRETSIRAPVDGRVLKWFVIEGDEVEEGQPLAELVDNDPEILQRLNRSRNATMTEHQALESAVAVVERQITILETARDAAISNAERAVEISQEKLAEMQQKRVAVSAKLATAKLNLSRIETLNKTGLASDRERELAQLEATTAESELEQTLASLRAAEHAVVAAESKLNEVRFSNDASINKTKADLEKLKAESSKVIAKLADAETKLSRQQQMVIHAPRTGRILSIKAREGSEFVKAGEVLGDLVPQSGIHAVEILVSGNDAPLITEKRKVRLQFEGWPAVQFVGWPSVAVGTFGGEVAFMDYAARDDGSFRVVIIPDPQDDPWPDQIYLRQGARARGWVLLNRVSIAYELWRQLNAFPPAMPAPPKTMKLKAKKA